MHSIHSHQELLYSLARTGDPAAFYTLVTQFANAAYIAERNSGKSHKEALAVLIPFFKKAYFNFITTLHQNTFDVWYRDFKKKYFHGALDRSSPAPAQAGTDFENIPMADIAHFGSILDLVLQRQYGKHRRTSKGRILLRLSAQFRQLHWMMKTAFVFALVGMVAIMFLCFLALTKKQLIVTYLSADTPYTVTLPFPANASILDQALLRHFGKTTLAGDTMTGEKVYDTLIIHDTVRMGPRNYQGSPLHGSSLSSAMGSTSASAPSAAATPPPGTSAISGTQSPPKPPQANKITSPVNAIKPIAPPSVGTAKSAYDSLQ
jgi:hypothetical protein